MAARDGRSQLLIVSGPAGIGKTTLCRHAVGRAAADGFNVAWGRSWPDGGAPALWPWTAVLSELVGRDAAGMLSEDPHRSAIDADRFSRFAAVANLLGSRTADAPLAIVLDDAHLADAAALLLVRFLVRTIDRCVIMLTRRDDDPDLPSETRRRLVELERDAVLVPLRSFDEQDTAAFLAAHGLQVEEHEWVPTLARLTGGSPLAAGSSRGQRRARRRSRSRRVRHRGLARRCWHPSTETSSPWRRSSAWRAGRAT